MSQTYPYLARSTIRYKSPHPTDLSFAKDETIRVTGPSPDDEDWLVGESVDGSRSGGFPRDFVVKVEEPDAPRTSESDAIGESTSAAPPQALESKEMQSNAVSSSASAGEPQDIQHDTRTSAAAGVKTDDDLAARSESLHIGEETSRVATAQPVAEPIATTSEPHPHPVSSPPPPTKTSLASTPTVPTESPEKHQSFRDKLAAFNRSSGNAGGPPPPLKPKPLGSSGGVGTWSWKQKQQQQNLAASEDTTRSAAAEISGGVVPQASAVPEAEPAAQPSAGMSASDAKTSIAAGGSLRERMAALAGAGAFGGDKPKGPPPPVASKPRVWKRPEAPAGAEGVADVGVLPGMRPSSAANDVATNERGAEPATESAKSELSGAGVADEGAEEVEDEDEQRREKERRAAIAARMAKLGGRGVMGMPMPIGGAAKATSVETEPGSVEHEDRASAEGAGFVLPPAEDTDAGHSRDIEPDNSTAESVSSPPASIVMPAIPRKAGPPRRKAPARTDTGGSAASSGSVPVNNPQATSVSVPPLQTDTPPPPANPPMQQVSSPTTEGDDREIPLPKTEEELAKEQEFEEAGKGPRGAEGAEAAGIALMPVDQAAQTEEASEGPPAPHHEVDTGTILHHQRSLPPPPPPVEDEDNDDDDDDDDNGAPPAEAQKKDTAPNTSFGDVNESSLPAEGHESQSAHPIGFQPLHAPAPIASGGEHVPPREHAISPANAPQSMLGLPKDEVEMKHDEAHVPSPTGDLSEGGEEEAEAPAPPARGIGLSDGEGERTKPAGPRPLPPSTRALPGAQGVAATRTVAPPPIASSFPEGTGGYQNPSGTQEGEKSPLPPRRQPSLQTSTSLGSASPKREADRIQAITQEPPVNNQESAQSSAPEDADAIRRQGIAARMAKLGGIKLGGPPMFQRSAAASGESPISPSVSGRNEALGSPTSPVPPPVAPIPATDSQAVPAAAEDETEEQAARRRQATLARLRAGGALGFGLFNNNPSVDEGKGERSPLDPSDHAELPSGEPTSPITRSSTAAEDYPQEQTNEPLDSRPVEHTEEIPAHGTEEEEEEKEEEEDLEEEAPPPPPPRRSLSIKSPVTSPNLSASATMPSFHAAARSTSRLSESQGPTPESGLVPPLPVAAPGQYVQEPDTMEETHEHEAADEVGPPPPSRVREPSTQPRSSLDRSESRASRLSTSSRTSERGLPPASPVMGSRRSESGARPGYTELREAARSHGVKVAKAAGKLIESGKKHAIGDGSPRALVWTAMAEAGLDANNTFGTLIWEQQGPTIQQRLDDIQIGDIVVLHDVKLKGKKGLLSYTQQAGSVQEPVFAVCSHVDDKKTKIKVYQYDRGHSDNVTYRLDDLQSGLVRIFRPMP